MKQSKISCTDPRELPGFKKPSFAMWFAGGEIWFEHLDGIYENSDLVIEKLTADSKTFCRPSKPSLICFNIDETEITEDIISLIADLLTGPVKRFTRVCFTGADRYTRNALEKALSRRNFALAFINDFEKAKQWLVSEGI